MRVSSLLDIDFFSSAMSFFEIFSEASSICFSSSLEMSLIFGFLALSTDTESCIRSSNSSFKLFVFCSGMLKSTNNDL